MTLKRAVCWLVTRGRHRDVFHYPWYLCGYCDSLDRVPNSAPVVHFDFDKSVSCTCPDVYVSSPVDFGLLEHAENCPAWQAALRETELLGHLPLPLFGKDDELTHAEAPIAITRKAAVRLVSSIVFDAERGIYRPLSTAISGPTPD